MTEAAEVATLVPPPAGANPTEGEQPGEVVSKHRKPKSRVRCKTCGKMFDGPNMKTKLGAHTYHAHGPKAAARAAATASKGNGSAVVPAPVTAVELKQVTVMLAAYETLSPSARKFAARVLAGK